MTKDLRQSLSGKPASTVFDHFHLFKPWRMLLSEMNVVFADTEHHKKQKQSYQVETV